MAAAKTERSRSGMVFLSWIGIPRFSPVFAATSFAFKPETFTCTVAFPLSPAEPAAPAYPGPAAEEVRLLPSDPEQDR